MRLADESDEIEVVGSNTTNHIFSNNFVGVARDGTQIANGGNGVTLSDDQSNSILDNTIAGNGGNGILVQGTASCRESRGESKCPTARWRWVQPRSAATSSD